MKLFAFHPVFVNIVKVYEIFVPSKEKRFKNIEIF